ncbi:hypothetical protein J3D55_004081 [Chryseobacterium ginsenosidimutans]|uniref:hypothetical protein n=1 Tax=Chryseobacterium ginsenosidimutans TaxID=687846 RepID=UPI00216A6493|nr:hypothetical protein [Chryseobacterium ginsenosidimutans]MCS3871165.1 hypothetical protein [Chryseobacterium ginsenosidimutans]
MAKFHSLFLIIISVLLINSCTGDDYTRIEIETPTENQIFSNGSSIHIKATIYDDGDSIMSEQLIVTSMEDNSIVKEINDNKFCFTYYIDESFVAAPNTKYKIEIKAYGGHQNLTSKVIFVQSN